MKTVGDRQEPLISFHASGQLLLEGARFNDELQRLPTGNKTFIPKGLKRFKNHREANQDWEDCVAAGIAQTQIERV